MILFLVAALQLAAPKADSLRITFLGTAGGPIGQPEWAGPATLIEYGAEVVLVDAGRGVVQRMSSLTRRIPQVRAVFLTHLHSDHTVGLPDLWLRSWWGEGRREPLEVRGPLGTHAMTEHIAQAWSYDVDIRSHAPENIDPAMAKLVGVDVDTGVVYDHDGLRVTAIKADHGPVLSLAYRIDAGGHSVVLSGDDRQSPQVIAHSQNVDVLVHSVGIWTPTPVGTWRGTSVCLVRPSPCNDEIVVYRITQMKGADSLSVDARKIVRGEEQEMGVLSCVLTPPNGLTCTIPRGVWHFSVRGDSLVGELRLPDNTRFRDVRTRRAP